MKRIFSTAVIRTAGGHILKRWTPVFLVAISIAALSLNQVTSAGSSQMIQLYVDGTSKILMTGDGTVRDVLESQGVEVGELDMVEPAMDAEIGGEGFHINIYRARPFMVVDDGQQFTINTPYSSPHLVAKAAGLTVYPEDEFEVELVEDFVKEQFIGRKLTVKRATPVVIEFDGHVFTARTHQTTVRDLLEEKGIELGEEDFTSLPLDTKLTDNLKFSVVRVGREIVTEEQQLPFDSRTVVDFNLPYGETEVRQKGKAGRIVDTYKVIRHNNDEVERSLISSVTVNQPVAEVVVKGMKQVRTYTSNAQILAALRQCETGGSYTRMSSNGLYYGAYQFLISTWNSAARTAGRPDLVGVRPDRAKPADQDQLVVHNARRSAGGFHSQHPGCSAKLNLPKHPF